MVHYRSHFIKVEKKEKRRKIKRSERNREEGRKEEGGRRKGGREMKGRRGRGREEGRGKWKRKERRGSYFSSDWNKCSC